MTAETDPGIAEEQPADDIASAIAAAIGSHDTPDPDKKAPDKVKPAEGEAALATRAKDGKFAKTEKPEGEQPEPKEPDKPEGEAKTEEKPDGEKTESKDKEVEPEKTAEAEITGKWSAADKEILKALPPEGRELILRRHKEMEGAYTKKTEAIAGFRKEYEPVDKIFEPYREKMKQAGWTPRTLIEGWASAEKRLMDGDGVAVIASLINGYKIDLGKVAQALGIRPRQQAPAPRQGEEPPPQPDGQATQLPPELLQQLQQLTTNQQKIDQRLADEDRRRADEVRRAQTSAEQRVSTEIDQFKSAQDDKGNLLHPHFEELETQMSLLAKAAIDGRQPVPPLKELYETAVWANPSTRAAAIAARDKAQREKADAEARAKAERAKKAGSSVTGAPGSSQAPSGKRPAERSLLEELEAAAEEAG